MSALIAVSVRSHLRRSQSTETMQKRLTKEKQAVLQLVLIVVSFLIGYVPFTGKKYVGCLLYSRMYLERFDWGGEICEKALK